MKEPLRFQCADSRLIRVMRPLGLFQAGCAFSSNFLSSFPFFIAFFRLFCDEFRHKSASLKFRIVSSLGNRSKIKDQTSSSRVASAKVRPGAHRHRHGSEMS